MVSTKYASCILLVPLVALYSKICAFGVTSTITMGETNKNLLPSKMLKYFVCSGFMSLNCNCYNCTQCLRHCVCVNSFFAVIILLVRVNFLNSVWLSRIRTCVPTRSESPLELVWESCQKTYNILHTWNNLQTSLAVWGLILEFRYQPSYKICLASYRQNVVWSQFYWTCVLKSHHLSEAV